MSEQQLIPTPGVFGENGNFLLERELGAGGMGGVYMGRDKMLDRPVAVKVMLKEYGEDAEFVEKFKKEAQAAAKLIHPNIAQVYSYGFCDGMPYIAMELAAGGSLYSMMNANPGKSDITRVLKICQQVAQALQCASDQGFVHGDVKPENILFDANGNAKLVDFGLASMQKDTDEIWGTPYYISPEKVKKEPVDFRADIYSLGGTLYHALTGVAPFEGEDSIAVVKKRFEGDPKKPSEIRAEITPQIDALVMKMLALDKEARFPSFEALLEAFKEVLSTGLTTKLPIPAATGVKPAATGGRKVMMTRGRRVMMKKKTAASSVPAPETDEPGAEGESPVSPDTAADVSDIAEKKDDDDEEEGGSNLGLKIAGVIIGVIAAIGLTVGGLIWYQIADRKARAAEEFALISNGHKAAKDAITDTVAKAKAFADEFDSFAKKAVEECEKPTDAIAKLLSAEHAAMLKPATSKVLEDAIASTNETVKVEAPAAPAGTNAVATAAVSNAAPAKAEAKAPAKADAKAPKAEAKSDAKADKPAPVPQVIGTMNELWDRAYSCLASAVKVRHQIRKLVKKGEEAAQYEEVTRENMEKLADLSRTLVDMLDQIKVSKDVENVRKGITFIKQKGESTVRTTEKQMRIEKLQAERKAKAEAAAAAEKERKEKAEAEHKAKIEAETAAIKEKFDAIVSQGCFRQLDWKSALRQLDNVKSEFKTAEGQIAADLQIRKVNDMKKIHDIFIKSLPNHVFKGKLKGMKVVKVNDKEMELVRVDGKRKGKITWQKFYANYPGNLNECINTYVVNGRQNAKPRLSLREWADAMTGAALTMQLVCAEVNGAIERSEKLVQESVKQFPEYGKVAQGIFPDMKLEVAAEE